ncbi:MAG: TlpA family protein disulfide reductase [Deltaproteobacteria bacterium]|nr:TlpA family protein disulfide reductase [Deltaproteobacteria bacterium]
MRRVRASRARAVVVGLIAALVAWAAQAAVAPGAALPAAAFRTVEGGTMTTAELRGKPVVIAFWATWCSTCKAELEHLKQLQVRHGADKLRVVAVSVDEEREALDAYLADHSFPFTMCHDPERAAANRFAEDEDLPLTVVADKDGVVRHVGREFNDTTRPALDAAVQALVAPPPAPPATP